MTEKSAEKFGKVRTRYAPSPTGFFHIGGARAALFNYLFTQKNKGAFVIRIEDTDKERSKLEFEKDILDSLKWLGIDYDEGPDVGGKYGSYRQSERLDIYEKYLKKLLEEKKAYYCFCSEDELEAQRQDQMSRGEAPKYSGKCRALAKEEVDRAREEGKPAVIRFEVEQKIVKVKDLIRGELEFDMGLAGDMVIAKSLRYPLFILAGAIDDYEMKISHVIRGEDHLPNTPKQILLQEALGLPKVEYAHLPMVLGPDRSKLSKRHGATAVSDYKKQGYLPEALLNFMVFLGWNPGGEREIFSLNSLIKEFSLEKVQKAGAIFNASRLDYLNGFYIRQRSLKALTELCIPYLEEAGTINKETDGELVQKAVGLYRERLKKLSEISEFADFFFKDKLEYPKELLKWKEMADEEGKLSLEKSEKLLSEIKGEGWTKEKIQSVLMPEAEKEGDRGKLLWPLRVALTGKKASAGPFEVAEALGKEKALKRLKEAIKIYES